MVEVIPSINVSTFKQVEEHIKRVEPYVKWCHLDVTDGVFSTHPTWREPADLIRLTTTLRVEAHLMVEKPERVIDEWLVKPVTRVIVHAEAVQDVPLLIKKCRDAGIQIGLAIRPDTSWEALVPWVAWVDLLQLLAVPPGPSGQKMDIGTVDKLVHLRRECPDCIIEVDGGITPETGRTIVRQGANILVVGSAIWNALDIGHAIEGFKRLAD